MKFKLLLIIVVNLWFLVPFISYSQRNLNVFSRAKYLLSNTTIYIWQAFMMTYNNSGTSWPTNQTQNEMPLSIGPVLLIGICMFLFYLIYRKGRIDERSKKICTGFLLIGSLGLFMCTDLFPWKYLESFSIIRNTFSNMQFPWRMLMIPAVCYSVVVAVTIDQLITDKQTGVAAVIMIVCFMSAEQCMSGYLETNITWALRSTETMRYATATDDLYLLSGDYSGVDFSSSNYSSDKDIGLQTLKGIVSNDSSFHLDSYNKAGTSVSVEYSIEDTPNDDPVTLQLPLYGFSEFYTAEVNGCETEVYVSDNHMLSIEIPKVARSGKIQITYREPLYLKVCDWISLAVMVIMLCWLLKLRKRSSNSKVSK